MSTSEHGLKMHGWVSDPFPICRNQGGKPSDCLQLAARSHKLANRSERHCTQSRIRGSWPLPFA